MKGNGMTWIDFITGVAFGIIAAGLYFATLALTIRFARDVRRPGALLLGGGALRIALLLLAGWSAAQIGAASAAGFAAAFLAVRTLAIALARMPDRAAA